MVNILDILVVVPYAPNEIRTRSYNIIRGLSHRGHNIHLVTLWENERDRISVEALRDHCVSVRTFRQSKIRSLLNCIGALPQSLPLQAVYSWSPETAQFFTRHFSSGASKPHYDIVHIEHLRGAKYGLFLKQLFLEQGIDTPILWDSVDCISLLFTLASRQSRSFFGRWITRFEIPRTEHFEAKSRDAFDQVIITSRVDADALRSLAPNGRKDHEIVVVPNGVDLDYFAPNQSVKRAAKQLVMSGKMSYHANVTMAVHFVQDIFPHILAQDPDIQLLIVGKDPSPEVKRLSNHSNVQVIGTVPDLRPYLWQATAAIVPLVYAVGVQNKVLEALACATPLVMSSACTAGLEIKSGREALVATDDREFARMVLSIIVDPEMGQRLGDQGREFVSENHDWGNITQSIEEVYHELISTNR